MEDDKFKIEEGLVQITRLTSQSRKEIIVRGHSHISTHTYCGGRLGSANEARQVKARLRLELLMKQVNFMYSNLTVLSVLTLSGQY